MKLKILREQQGLTQKQVAQKIGIPYYNYNKYELEKVNIDNKTLCQIADFYGVSLDYLCDHKSLALELPPLDENQKQLIKVITQLNRDNLGLAYGFVMGLYQKQLQA